jgi:ferredoxin
MPHVVIDACIGCRHKDCLDVCPVDCFHDNGAMLVINPDECIDCGACVPVCPVDAIFEIEEVPDDKKIWIANNETDAKLFPLCES